MMIKKIQVLILVKLTWFVEGIQEAHKKHKKIKHENYLPLYYKHLESDFTLL